MESDQEKMVRYRAVLLMERKGLSADVAWARAERQERRHEAEMGRARNEIRKSLYAPKGQNTQKQASKTFYRLHGPPMQGGAPGLGKKK